MSIESSSLEAVTKELEKMIEKMKEIGLLPKNTDVKELAESVVNTLKNDNGPLLTPEKIKQDPSVFKSLQIACMAESIPNNKFDYTLLLKKDLNLEKDDLKHQLKNVFTEMLKLSPANKKNRTAEEEAELDEQLNKLVEGTVQKLDNDPDNMMHLLSQTLLMLSFMSEAKESPEIAHNRMLTGIGKIGEVFQPTLDVSLGDQIGVINYMTSGKSFLAERNNPDPTVPDPLGIKFAAIINYLADGQTNKFEEKMLDFALTPSAAPKPQPPGTQTH